MTLKALVATPKALDRLSRYVFEDSWFERFDLPTDAHGIRRAHVDGITFLFEDDLENDDGRLVVITAGLSASAVLQKDQLSSQAFARIRSVIAANQSKGFWVPYNYRGYKTGAVTSFFAAAAGGARIHVHTAPNGRQDFLFFGRTPGRVDENRVDPPLALHRQARDSFVKAILEPDIPGANRNREDSDIELWSQIDSDITRGHNLEEWISVRLSKQQRAFVDHAYDGPMRLRGPAGTGKTLALILKFTKDLLAAQSETRDWRVLFLVHSEANAQRIRENIDYLAPTLLNEHPTANGEVKTIYGLAYEFLNESMRQLEPVSMDGFEGRKYQREFVIEAIVAVRENRFLMQRLRPGLAEHIKADLDSLDRGSPNRLVLGLAMEFACVLEPERIRLGAKSGETYLKRKGRRRRWLYPLPSPIDREFVLEVHSEYRNQLEKVNAVSIEEMLAELKFQLDGILWQRNLPRVGYDAIFVDEFHLFNLLEKQLLPKLIRPGVDAQGVPNRPNLIMAIDPKQGSTAGITNGDEEDASLSARVSEIRGAKSLELSKIFRSTPEITRFVQDIDKGFPTFELLEDWYSYVGDSNQHPGDQPSLVTYSSENDMLREVSEAAVRALSRGTVAVLSLSEERHGSLRSEIMHNTNNRAILVDDKEDASGLRYAKKRFVYGMPTYVTGEQFDIVYLIHCDAKECSVDDNPGFVREFLRDLYVGATRARRELHICVSNEAGGPSPFLDGALARRSLIKSGPLA